MSDYTSDHARGGVEAPLPEIECWPNQYPHYEVTITHPEFTCVCPKTGLPDFGIITIKYFPDKRCVELKSLKEYLLAYRQLGIFNENVVNRILRDFVAACSPVSAEVTGEFTPRGGIRTTVVARYPSDR